MPSTLPCCRWTRDLVCLEIWTAEKTRHRALATALTGQSSCHQAPRGCTPVGEWEKQKPPGVACDRHATPPKSLQSPDLGSPTPHPKQQGSGALHVARSQCGEKAGWWRQYVAGQSFGATLQLTLKSAPAVCAWWGPSHRSQYAPTRQAQRSWRYRRAWLPPLVAAYRIPRQSA